MADRKNRFERAPLPIPGSEGPQLNAGASSLPLVVVLVLLVVVGGTLVYRLGGAPGPDMAPATAAEPMAAEPMASNDSESAVAEPATGPFALPDAPPTEGTDGQ